MADLTLDPLDCAESTDADDQFDSDLASLDPSSLTREQLEYYHRLFFEAAKRRAQEKQDGMCEVSQTF